MSLAVSPDQGRTAAEKSPRKKKVSLDARAPPLRSMRLCAKLPPACEMERRSSPDTSLLVRGTGPCKTHSGATLAYASADARGTPQAKSPLALPTSRRQAPDPVRTGSATLPPAEQGLLVFLGSEAFVRRELSRKRQIQDHLLGKLPTVSDLQCPWLPPPAVLCRPAGQLPVAHAAARGHGRPCPPT